MNIDKVGNEMLLYIYSQCLKRLDALYVEKKKIEAEIARRNDQLIIRYQQGLIKHEMED